MSLKVTPCTCSHPRTPTSRVWRRYSQGTKKQVMFKWIFIKVELKRFHTVSLEIAVGTYLATQMRSPLIKQIIARSKSCNWVQINLNVALIPFKHCSSLTLDQAPVNYCLVKRNPDSVDGKYKQFQSAAPHPRFCTIPSDLTCQSKSPSFMSIASESRVVFLFHGSRCTQRRPTLSSPGRISQ